MKPRGARPVMEKDCAPFLDRQAKENKERWAAHYRFDRFAYAILGGLVLGLGRLFLS